MRIPGGHGRAEPPVPIPNTASETRARRWYCSFSAGEQVAARFFLHYMPAF